MKKENEYELVIVDDDTALLSELESMLNSEGYHVTCFDNGDAALAAIDDLHPDLILLDLKMPGISGFELADILHHRPHTRQVPIVAMTGTYTDDEFILSMRLCGIRHEIFKPILPGELIAVLEQALTTPKAGE